MKKMLVLTPRLPYPVIGGDRLRIVQLCEALSESFKLTLLSFCESREECQAQIPNDLFSEVHRIYLPRWKSYFNVLTALIGSEPLQIAYYRSAKFREKLEELISGCDVVLAHLIRTGQYLVGRDDVPYVLEMTDAISLNYSRMLNDRVAPSIKKTIFALEFARLREYEIKIIHQAPLVWLVSETDKLFLDSRPISTVEIIRNSVDLHSFPFNPVPSGGDTIAFIGNMDTAQNQDACLYFIRSILPMVRAREMLKFRIVGNASKRVAKMFRKYEGVEVTGRVDEIRNAIDSKVFCGVCPVQAGAGIQNKVLNYLALGLPCIVSRVGVEGIDAEPGRDLLVFNDAEEAARQVLAVYYDSDLRTRLAFAGRKAVEEGFSVQALKETIVGSVSRLLDANSISRLT